jgi:hypothetical protein
MISCASPAHSCSPVWYIHGLNHTVGRRTSSWSAAASRGWLRSICSVGAATARRSTVQTVVAPTALAGSGSPWLRALRPGGVNLSGLNRQSESSGLSGGSSRAWTIRITDVLPAPHGPLIPIVSGGLVFGCWMNSAIARA